MLLSEIEKIYSLYNQCNGIVETDTRKIQDNCLFFCLVGENFDGNTFAIKALELGAQFVISSDKSICNELTIFYVNNTLIALQNLARHHRESLNIPIFAIGGSNGKTTTKELCNAVARTKYKTYSTPGNFNNHIGLPLTILAINSTIEFAILEMGTNHPGEMLELINIGDPTMGSVTNIGKEHLEGFGTVDAIVKEESELLNYLLVNNGSILLNQDDPWLNNMSKRISADNKISYGFTKDCDLCAVIIETMPHAAFELYVKNKNLGKIQLKIGGSFNIINALAALAMGLKLNIDWNEAIKAIESYEPTNNRSQWISFGNSKILLDAYNANPSSVELAVSEFAKLDGDKLILLGDMFELGNQALNEHLNIIKLCNKLENCTVFFCGKNYKEAGPQYSNIFESREELELKIKNMQLPPYTLIKGSRGMKMEELLKVIPS